MIIIDDDGVMHKVLPMDTLDKLRAEIIDNAKRCMNDTRAEGLYMALTIVDKYKAESDHKCHNCKHYTSGQRDGSCGSYICKNYSGWESEE